MGLRVDIGGGLHRGLQRGQDMVGHLLSSLGLVLTLSYGQWQLHMIEGSLESMTKVNDIDSLASIVLYYYVCNNTDLTVFTPQKYFSDG